MDNCFRNLSFSPADGCAVADRVTLSFLDSDKELFPCACAAEAAIKHHPITHCEMPIPNLKRLVPHLFNRQSEIGNRNTFLLGHLRRMRTVFSKHACRRKFAELVTDHILGDKNGIKRLPP